PHGVHDVAADRLQHDGDLEPAEDPRVLLRGDVEVLQHRGRGHPERAARQVVDDRACHQQAHHPPAESPQPRHRPPTTLSSVPIGGMVIAMASPASSVKSSGGTTPVPVSSTAPCGKLVSRYRYWTSSSGVRRICASEVLPWKMVVPFRMIVRAMVVSGGSGVSAISIPGPSAHEPSYTFACGR